MHSRRRFLAATATSATALALTRGNLFADDTHAPTAAAGTSVVDIMRTGGATASIETVPLRGNLHVLLGSGGNIGVLSSPAGKLLVDAGLATSKPALQKALAALGPAPVTTVINTHWHFDHTDGNEWLHAAGATVIAHENTLKRMSESTRVEAWNFTFPPALIGARPTHTVKNDLSTTFAGVDITAGYFGPSHTDSDLWVYFKQPDVFQTGDIWWNGHYPFIDYSTGGSIDGTLRAVEVILSKVSDTAQIIPGHGPVGTRKDLLEYRDVLSDIRKTVAEMKKKGMSLPDIIAAKPTTKYDAKWGTFVINPATFTTLVHAGV